VTTEPQAPGANGGGSPSTDFADRSGQLMDFLPTATLRELSQVNPVASTLLVALQYGMVVAAAWISEAYWHPVLYMVAVMVIGARQQMMGLLMHDAAHYRLYRSRKLNDFVGHYLLALPLMQSLHGYRAVHTQHHRYLLSEQDEDRASYTRYPVSRRSMALELVTSLLGVDAFQFVRHSTRGNLLLRLLVVSVLAGLGVLAFIYDVLVIRLLLLYWLVPAFTWLLLISHLRVLGEHSLQGDGPHHPLGHSWNIELNLFERLFIMPQSNAYHAAHHVYPSVPLFRLTRLHLLLMENPEYRARARVARGYWDILVEKTASSQTRPVSG